MTKIKAVIFDMDGVLVDAREWHYEALNRALEIFGFSISRYDHLTTYDGLPTRVKLEMLTKERGLPLGLHQLINEMKQIFTLEMIAVHCKASFNHEYALSRLKSDGYKLSVASNSIRHTIETMLTRSSLIEYLEFYLSAEDVEFGKPDPAIYIQSIKKLGLQPHECLVLEDNENGKKSASLSGAHLLEIDDPSELTYDSITSRISMIEASK